MPLDIDEFPAAKGCVRKSIWALLKRCCQRYNDSLPHFLKYIRKRSKSSLKIWEKILRRDEELCERLIMMQNSVKIRQTADEHR